jgi:hypothetical protein
MHVKENENKLSLLHLSKIKIASHTPKLIIKEI